MFFIRIPKQSAESAELSLIKSAKSGLDFLKSHKQVLMLIMYLSAINLVASMYEAVLPAMVLSRKGGGTEALGAVSRRCNAYRQHNCYTHAKAQKQKKGDMSFSSVFDEYGKLLSCIRANTASMVYRRCARMDTHTDDERKP